VRPWIALLTLAGAGCTAVEAPGDHHALTPASAPRAAAAAAAASAPPALADRAATPLPAVSLLGLDDRAQRLDEAAAGRPALVSFWATWCEACATEFDALNRLDERVHGSGGVVIGVAVGEPREKAAAFAREHGLRYAQLVDEKMTLADALGQKRLPATIVLDRQGRVIFAGGALDERALSALRGAMGP
jgi:peroxiredoxin